ncbi:ribose-phosphate pyrophosphokinase [Candidatus Micrarchaeota archaeon]|nr:ribose-phosphate pyrophosphokinase [Candidatus Micrarchaeota archaeon]
MRLISPNFADLEKPNLEIKTFPDGDSYVRVPGIEKFSGQEVTLFHRLYPNQNSSLIEALFILKTLKKIKCTVTLVAPYLPYSRQDKIFLEGETESAKIVCNFLAESGVDELVTFDCHFLKKEGAKKYGRLKITNISLANTLVEKAKEKFGSSEFLTISPDQGAAYMASNSMKKKRGNYETGVNAYREVKELNFDFDVSGKSILIIDDMVSTGGTMIKAIENVKKNGAKKVGCAATHGFFLNDSLQKLRSMCEFVFVSNSIQSPVSQVNIMDHLGGYL